MKQRIKVHNPNKLPVMNFHEMHGFQGDLKLAPSRDSIKKLGKSILKHGVFVPKFVWIDGEGVARLLDGHQTRAALEALEAEGYEIPPIPYLTVKANDETDAAEKLLQLNSRYAAINPDTEWFNQLGISGDELTEMLDAIEIPEIDIDKILPSVSFAFDGDTEQGEQRETRFEAPNRPIEQNSCDGDMNGYLNVSPRQDRAMRPAGLENFEPAETGKQEQKRVIIVYELGDQKRWLETMFGVALDRVIYHANELMRG